MISMLIEACFGDFKILGCNVGLNASDYSGRSFMVYIKLNVNPGAFVLSVFSLKQR